MFCASIRRRPSLVSVIPTLTSPTDLGLRESQLTTHDLEIPIKHQKDSPKLRVLVLSPSSLESGILDVALQRIEHFAHLTNEPIAIIFVLSPPKDTSFQTAKELAQRTLTSDGQSPDTEGLVAYTKLQVELMDHAFPSIPMLPLSKLISLSGLLKKHIAALTRPPQPRLKQPEIYRLLSTCALDNQQSAYILSDIFSSLREIAQASLASADNVTNSSSPIAIAAFANEVLSQSVDNWNGDLTIATSSRDNGIATKVKALQDLVGKQEKDNLMEFWRQEWSLEG